MSSTARAPSPALEVPLLWDGLLSSAQETVSPSSELWTIPLWLSVRFEVVALGPCTMGSYGPLRTASLVPPELCGAVE